MQQRLSEGAHGGLWEFPGGKLEPGEGPEDAAVRELGEELGVAIDPADLTPVAFASGRASGVTPRPLVILLFLCPRWGGDLVPQAAAQVRWCDPASIADLPMPPLDYPLAAALRRMLGA